jgi:hypothetical protein
MLAARTRLHEAGLGANERRTPNRVMIAVRGARFGGLEKAAVRSSHCGVGWPWAAAACQITDEQQQDMS